MDAARFPARRPEGSSVLPSTEATCAPGGRGPERVARLGDVADGPCSGREQYRHPAREFDGARPPPPGDLGLEALPVQGGAGHGERVAPICVPERSNLSSGPLPTAERVPGAVEIDLGARDGVAAVGTVDQPVIYAQLALKLVIAISGQGLVEGLGSEVFHGRHDGVNPSPGGNALERRADNDALQHFVPHALARPEAEHRVVRYVERPDVDSW